MKTDFSNKLLNWYYSHGRSMPWRGEKNIYRIWLSEVMLQQTQVETVKPYYLNWINKYPSISSVAKAEEEEILKAWEGLGYYARARNFKQACDFIVKHYNGVLPNDTNVFKQLKGVGNYIHAAVRSIGYNDIIPVIDGNVKRVLSRFLEINSPPSKLEKKIYDFLINKISSKKPGDFNQAMMDLGSTICKPKNPLCNLCPISSTCNAHINKTINKFPAKTHKAKVPHYKIATGVIWKNDKILISKRHSNVMLGGLWEFPGGKIKNNESPKKCVEREIKEELNINVSVYNLISTIKHSYSHFSIELKAYNCKYEKGKPKAVGCADFKWIKKRDLKTLPFPKANHKLFEKISEHNPC